MEVSNMKNLTSSAHLKNVQQIAVFSTSSNTLYGINIAKVKAFIIKNDIVITHTPSKYKEVVGIATIRQEPIITINLDKWLGNKILDDNEYKLIIYAEFNNKKIGFLVKEIITIVEKNTDELINSKVSSDKITYLTYVDNKLCTIFNAEQLLTDIGMNPLDKHLINSEITKINSNKLVLAVEDSKIARNILEESFQKANLTYKLFNDGKEIIDYLKICNTNDIGLIITDIEMPNVDGFQVVKYVKDNSKFNNISVVVNSSMSSNAVVAKMKSLGINDFICKTNIPEINKILNKYLNI